MGRDVLCLNLFRPITCCFTLHIIDYSLEVRKHVSIRSNCALRRVTGNAVLAVDLCLLNSIKPFSSLSFSSPAFFGPAFSTFLLYGSWTLRGCGCRRTSRAKHQLRTFQATAENGLVRLRCGALCLSRLNCASYKHIDLLIG